VIFGVLRGGNRKNAAQGPAGGRKATIQSLPMVTADSVALGCELNNSDKSERSSLVVPKLELHDPERIRHII